MRQAARWLKPSSWSALTAFFREEGPTSFFDQLFHRVVLKREIGDDPAHSCVLVLDRAGASQLATFHATVF